VASEHYLVEAIISEMRSKRYSMSLEAEIKLYGDKNGKVEVAGAAV
jgi:hypothetical protein